MSEEFSFKLPFWSCDVAAAYVVGVEENTVMCNDVHPLRTTKIRLDTLNMPHWGTELVFWRRSFRISRGAPIFFRAAVFYYFP